MKGIFTLFIIHIFLLSNITSPELFTLLEKYKTKTTTNGFFIFHSETFKDGETMSFEIECPGAFLDENVYYYYLDIPEDFDITNDMETKEFTRISEDEGIETGYLDIKKESSDYEPTNGKYLFIQFYCEDTDHEAKITSVKPTELSTTEIIIIVVVIFVAIVIGAIFWLWKRKKASQNNEAPIDNNNNVNVNNNNYNNNYNDDYKNINFDNNYNSAQLSNQQFNNNNAYNNGNPNQQVQQDQQNPQYPQ